MLLSSGEITPPCGTPRFPGGFEHDLQQVHHVGIVHALGYFRQQPIVPDIVERKTPQTTHSQDLPDFSVVSQIIRQAASSLK